MLKKLWNVGALALTLIVGLAVVGNAGNGFAAEKAGPGQGQPVVTQNDVGIGTNQQTAPSFGTVNQQAAPAVVNDVGIGIQKAVNQTAPTPNVGISVNEEVGNLVTATAKEGNVNVANSANVQNAEVNTAAANGHVNIPNANAPSHGAAATHARVLQ